MAIVDDEDGHDTDTSIENDGSDRGRNEGDDDGVGDHHLVVRMRRGP